MEGLPQRIGKYHVLGLIARGGMAEIYKVKTVGIAGFEKIQALKRIHPAYAAQPRFIRSFIDEARIAVELNHRNIVQVFDFGRASGELYLAMELIDGVDLKNAIRAAAGRNIELPMAVSCHILGEVGAGLEYAHRKRDTQGRALDIVHCDISPQNIGVSREGFVKILDFGIARAQIGSVSVTRRLRGKPRYMAPEQTRGDRPTSAADVFALGIVAWELMTGMPLFEAKDLKGILDAVRRVDAPPPNKLNPDVPEPLSLAISRALSADPEARGSAGELSAALHQAARALQPGSGARGLANWLAQVYPDQEDEELSVVTSVDGPVAVAAADTTMNTMTSTLAGGLLDRLDVGATVPVALMEKCRVVAIAVVASGGNDRSRLELSHMLADLAYKRGAVVQDEADDSLVVLYGLEVAGEDNVALAMGFALDAVELTREASVVTTGDLSIRIAARAGIVAKRSGDGYHLVGDGVEEALGLARDAEAGRPLLAGAAGRVSSAYYSFRDLPARRYRRRRLRVLELVGLRSFDERTRALRGRRGSFVGRETELEALAEVFAGLVARRRRCSATVVGQPGVGKSRLVAEFVARTADRSETPPLLIAIGANPAANLAPFSLITELFQAGLNLPPGRGRAARTSLTQRLRHVLTQAQLSSSEIDEATAAVELAVEIRDGALLSNPGLGTDLRERVARALQSFRTAILRAPRPLITVIEDLHLADPASLAVLRSNLRLPAQNAPGMVLITSRGGELTGLPVDHCNIRIELEELTASERKTLIAERLADAASEQTIEAVSRRAGGNPLFIEELAAAVRDRDPGDIPASARDVVVSRVDQLPPAAKAALQHAAVIGRNFRARILEELLGAELHEELSVLFDEELVTRADPGRDGADEGELAFAHDLFQEVVYESLSGSAKRQTHAKLGQLLASRYQAGREEPPATVARHLERGGELQSASAYWLRAGALSLAAYDARAAADGFTRALALEEGRPQGQRTAAGKARVRKALLGRERAFATLGDHEAQVRDLEALQRKALGLPRVTADVQCRVAAYRSRLGQYQAAIEASAAAEAAAAEAGDERLRGEALRVRAEAYERQGHYSEALDVLRRALEIFRRIGANADETLAMMGHARINLMRAQYEAARDAYGAIIERIHDSGDPWLERIAENHRAVIYLSLGEYERAMRCARRAVEVCDALGDRAREGDNLSVCGNILSTVGCFEEAAQSFASALEIHDENGSRWSRGDCLVFAGENACRLGDVEGGIAQMEEGMAIGREISAKYIEANALIALSGALLGCAIQHGEVDRQRIDRALEAATQATMIARETRMVGPEVQGLSRQARAMGLAGYADAAIALSTRAVRLLQGQRYVEGSEEEIYYTHYRLLIDGGIAGAKTALEHAIAGFERKLGAIEQPDWRRAFSGAVPLHVELQREARAQLAES